MKFNTSILVALNNAVAVGAFGTSRVLKKKAIGFAVDTIVEKISLDNAAEENNWSRETKLILSELDCANTQFIAAKAGPSIEEAIATGGIGTDADFKTADVTVGWEKNACGEWEKTETPTYIFIDLPSGSWTGTILRVDDMSGNERSKKDNIVRKVLNSDITFPLEDSDFTFADMAQAERVLKDLRLNPGAGFPETYNTDFDMQSDESFSRIFFHGIGAPLVMDQPEVTDPEHLKYGPFVVDLEFAADLEVRDDRFRKYGARIHFDENKKVTAIYDSEAEKLVRPGEPDWEVAKMQAKVTAFTVCTVREHLVQTHLLVSNDASREIVMNLHPEHPIRRLLAIFTYNAVSVNQNAGQELVPDRCTIHRALPLDYENGVIPLFENAVKESIAYQPFPDREIKNKFVKALTEENEKKQSGFPYYNEGCEYYEIARTMVREWLEKAGDEASDEYAKAFYEAMQVTTVNQKYTLPDFSHDNMVDLVTTIVWTVTGYHEIIGHVADYVVRPDMAGFRLSKENPLFVDAQSCILGTLIGASTALPAPQLMAPFEDYIGKDAPAWERDVWTKFVYKMGLQAKKVQENDRKRDFEFKYFDPSLFECSVSV